MIQDNCVVFLLLLVMLWSLVDYCICTAVDCNTYFSMKLVVDRPSDAVQIMFVVDCCFTLVLVVASHPFPPPPTMAALPIIPRLCPSCANDPPAAATA